MSLGGRRKNACSEELQRFSRRVIALWLPPKLLTTQDSVRLDLGGLGRVGSLL